MYRKPFPIIFILQVFCLLSCAQQKAVVSNTIAEESIAFPGAEGFGKFTTGGRGGEVIIVSNLNDNGEGSFRKAVQKNGSKIIVFTVSGTIHLESPLNIKGNTTIAGQTAPGDGICIADYPVQLGGDNIIVRYLRFRMGDRHQNVGQVAGSGHDDAFSGMKRKNIIIDHCTMSWSTDETFSVYAGDSTTLQWNLMSEPLNYSYHFEKGDTDFERHGYGGIWGGRHFSAHHNLFAHCLSRTPRFDGIRNTPEENVDFRNNVIYNWGANNVYAGEGGTYNIINNYYKPGPETKANVRNRIVNPFKTATIPFGKFYVEGNYVEGATEVNQNNWKGVVMDKGTESDAQLAKLKQPFGTVSINTQDAQQAYDLVLQWAGASFKRDTLDQRIINDVIKGTGRFIDVQGGFPHGTDYAISKSAWPGLKSLPAPLDSDGDGIPDDWEKKNRLNPNDKGDGAATHLHKHYTNIEVYINSLIK
jgi:pectate lyase